MTCSPAGWGASRSWSHARLVERLDPAIAPLAAALLLGRREEVEPEVNDAFARTGTTHLLAISGLQLQALAGALSALVSRDGLAPPAGLPGRRRVDVRLCLLVGLAPSVVRSTVMTATFCLAAIAHRMARPANTLALAALATLGINPSFLFDIGCQLSFLAIAAIVWLVPPGLRSGAAVPEMIRTPDLGPPVAARRAGATARAWWRRTRADERHGMVDGVVGSTVVWLAALPLVASRFHIVSPIGILLNIPLIPLTSIALLLSGAGAGAVGGLGSAGGPARLGRRLAVEDAPRRSFSGASRSPGDITSSSGRPRDWVLVFYILLGLGRRLRNCLAGQSQPSRAGWLTGGLVWWLLAAWFDSRLAAERHRPRRPRRRRPSSWLSGTDWPSSSRRPAVRPSFTIAVAWATRASAGESSPRLSGREE